MQFPFTFALRLFLAFITAKFVVRWFGWGGLWPLLGFTALFLGNCYLFDLFDSLERNSWRRLLGRGRKSPSRPVEDGSSPD